MEAIPGKRNADPGNNESRPVRASEDIGGAITRGHYPLFVDFEGDIFRRHEGDITKPFENGATICRKLTGVSAAQPLHRNREHHAEPGAFVERRFAGFNVVERNVV